MSTGPARRHALGLPAGSIRAAHVLMIVGLVCAILLVPGQTPQPIPPYLIYLLFMILGHFFTAIHSSGSGNTPLYLPVGLLRLVIFVALAGTVGWMLFHDEPRLQAQFERSVDELKTQPFLPLILLGAFFFGVLVRAIVGREFPPVALQDMEAWLSLLALCGLGIAVIYHVFIAPTLVEQTPSMPMAEAVLAAVIAFYFGERS